MADFNLVTTPPTHLKVTVELADYGGVGDSYRALTDPKNVVITLVDSDRSFSEHEARELVAAVQTLYAQTYADPAAAP